MTACPDLPELRNRLRALPGLEEWRALAQWSRLLDLVAVRRALPPGAPLVTVLLGPTGAGKSTLFNAALGAIVSETGAVRPCTGHPVAVGTLPPLDPFLAGLEVRPLPGGGGSGPHLLVDTPDFDSVADGNRRAAEALLHRADRVVLVLSPEKYADASVWDVVEALGALGGVAGVVFNKSEGGVALSDCRRLLAEAGLPEPLAVPRVAAPDAPGWLPEELAGRLRELLLAPGAPGPVLAARRQAAEAQERAIRSDEVSPWVEAVAAALVQAELDLGRLEAGLGGRIRDRLPLQLDDALGRELQTRFLKQIERYDLLREPRRWLQAPLRALRGALPFLGGHERDIAAQPAGAWLAAAHQDRYLELLRELAADLRGVAGAAGAAAEPRLPWPEVPELGPGEAAHRLEAAFAGLQTELEGESARIAEGLSLAGKAGFFGSQVVLNVLMLGVLVHTGGGLSLADVAAQGLVSPYVAKLAAHLVSTGEAATVQRRLEGFLGREVAAGLRPWLAPHEARVAELRGALGTAEEWRTAAARWEAGRVPGG